MSSSKYAYGQVSERTERIREAMGCVSSLCKSGKFDVSKAQGLKASFEQDLSDVDDVFVHAAISLLTKIVEDGKISNDEYGLLANLVETYEKPISDDPVTQVDGKRFVLSGDFVLEGGKQTAKEMILSAGGRVIGSVSRRTDYVVVGNKGNAAWAFGNFGNKIKKALDLRLNGTSKVAVVSEEALLSYFCTNCTEAMQILEQKSKRYQEQWESAITVRDDFEGLTDGQQHVFNLVKEGKNVYLTGLGGTGKSFILERIIRWAESSNKNVIVCAPTGIAALNVGGCTLHRALQISPNRTLQQDPYVYITDDSPLPECDLMIVDEISMCRMDLFDYLSAALKKVAYIRAKEGKPMCQLVVVGDFCQLPPVVPKAEKSILDQKYERDVGDAYCFTANSWDYWNFNKVELTEAIRQRDVRFVAALNACRVGDLAGVRWIEKHASKVANEHAIVLCGTNAQADGENRKRLKALPSRETKYSATIDGMVAERDMPTSKALSLKPGARVMALVNDSERTYMNGTLGTVVSCTPNKAIVRFDGMGTCMVSPHVWEITEPRLVDGKIKNETIGTFKQIPLKLAWAITIHKSQGQTFDSALVYPRCWEAGQLYTALSRLTSVEGLCLAHHIDDSSLVTSPDVLDFLED